MDDSASDEATFSVTGRRLRQRRNATKLPKYTYDSSSSGTDSASDESSTKSSLKSVAKNKETRHSAKNTRVSAKKTSTQTKRRVGRPKKDSDDDDFVPEDFVDKNKSNKRTASRTGSNPGYDSSSSTQSTSVAKAKPRGNLLLNAKNNPAEITKLASAALGLAPNTSTSLVPNIVQNPFSQAIRAIANNKSIVISKLPPNAVIVPPIAAPESESEEEEEEDSEYSDVDDNLIGKVRLVPVPDIICTSSVRSWVKETLNKSQYKSQLRTNGKTTTKTPFNVSKLPKPEKLKEYVEPLIADEPSVINLDSSGNSSDDNHFPSANDPIGENDVTDATSQKSLFVLNESTGELIDSRTNEVIHLEGEPAADDDDHDVLQSDDTEMSGKRANEKEKPSSKADTIANKSSDSSKSVSTRRSQRHNSSLENEELRKNENEESETLSRRLRSRIEENQEKLKNKFSVLKNSRISRRAETSNKKSRSNSSDDNDGDARRKKKSSANNSKQKLDDGSSESEDIVLAKIKNKKRSKSVHSSRDYSSESDNDAKKNNSSLNKSASLKSDDDLSVQKKGSTNSLNEVHHDGNEDPLGTEDPLQTHREEEIVPENKSEDPIDISSDHPADPIGVEEPKNDNPKNTHVNDTNTVKDDESCQKRHRPSSADQTDKKDKNTSECERPAKKSKILDDSDEDVFTSDNRSKSGQSKRNQDSSSSESSRRKKVKHVRVPRISSESDEEKSNPAPENSTKEASDCEKEDTAVVKEKSEDDKNDGSSSDDIFTKRVFRRQQKAPEKSSGSNAEDKEEDRPKVRRRIKKVNDSDDEDGSDDDDGEDSPGKRRKNIRKVLKDEKLSSSTKEAAKEEEQRKRRILERQKLYNKMYEIGDEKNAKVDKIVLDFDPKTKTELVKVHPNLTKKLKPHQANGVKFMWDACFESLEQMKKSKGSGCILAHCMGLGKTLQVITLIHTLLTHEKTGVQRVMVVCPLSTVLNWCNEFRIWMKDVNGGEDINVFELSRYKKMYERAHKVEEWIDEGGVLVIGYELFRILSNKNNKAIKKKNMLTLQKGLVDPGPDLVVCDEGHLLKNEKSALSIAMNCLKTMRRIVLTGTPLQNNLKEYYCMVQFVKPNLLGKFTEYTNRFVNPITNGQYTDSTPQDIAVMRRRAHVLHTMLDGIVQRRDYNVLAPYLPPKQEYVIFLQLTDVQIELYEIYMREYSKRSDVGKGAALFADFQTLQRIWTHPRALRFHSDKKEKEAEKKLFNATGETDSEGSLRDFIDDEEEDMESTPESSSISISSDDDDSHKKRKKKKNKKKKRQKSDDDSTDAPAVRRRTRAAAAAGIEFEEPRPLEEVERIEGPTEWWVKHLDESELDRIENSSKLLILFEVLKKSEQIGDKVLVFSQSLYSLDLIEYFLEKVDEATQNGTDNELFNGMAGSWSLGLDYFRLDGSSSIDSRHAWCKSFNDESNPRARLFLISTKAGGLGINLVAANRVIIFDVSWNPSHDIQSIFRIYRFGQNKPCYVYRFISMGTMEEKVYERQVTKQAISKRVIDEQQIDRHYNQNDLAELYKFEPKPPEPRPIPNLPKDRLFAEVLKENESLIWRYHEHDSLLENKEAEQLDETERKKAWEEFENEKKAKPILTTVPNPFASMFNRPQMTYNQAAAAIDYILRTKNTDWPEEEIKAAVPVVLQQMYARVVDNDFSMYNLVLNTSLLQQQAMVQQPSANLQQQLWAAQARLINPMGTQNVNILRNNRTKASTSRHNANEVVNID